MSQERASPSRLSRAQEKEELVELNDRFLQYIEQVRSMKEANLSLEVELSNIKEQIGNEAESVKALYEAELADARNLIDETAKEKARQQIIASKNASRIEELETDLKEVRDALDRMETKYSVAERNATSAEAQRKSAIADKNKLQKQVKELEAELKELRENYDALKSSLESETLSKVDLQNHIQSLREEMAFRKKVYEEELANLHEKGTGMSFSGVYETKFQAELDSRLLIAIDELREKSEDEINHFKCELEARYKDKIAALEKQCVRDASMIAKLNMDLKKTVISHPEQDNEKSKLQRKIEKLETTIHEKNNELERARRQHSDELALALEEARQRREECEKKMHEYEELMDLKIQLDQEIATYRALLTGEETRLNLTPTPREKRTRSYTTTEHPAKKPRPDSSSKTFVTQSQKTSSSSSAAGPIQITDVDSDGHYIEITNTSDDTESIGGLKIQHEVQGGDEVSFRFHNKSKLQGGASVKVWSGDAENAKHNPPTDLICRNQTWGSGSKTVTKLIKGGEDIALFKQSIEGVSPCKRREEVDTGSMDSSTHSFPNLPTDTDRDSGSSSGRTTTHVTKRYTVSSHSGSRKAGGEHVFHQKGDPEAGDKSCVIS